MTRPLSPTVMLLVAVLILISVTIPTFRFRDRNYHSDEVNTVHAGVMLDVVETAQWMAEGGIHPAGWRILGVYWVKLVGVTEGATRWLSALCAMLALALVYRLGADLFDQRTGLYALFLLGTVPFALFYMYELRPYPVLALVTAGLLLSLLRWVHRPRFSYALLFVLFGVAALQTHYFAAYILAGLALTFLVLVRWERGRYLRAFGLFAAIALSFTVWLPPIIHGFLYRGPRGYTLPTNWDTLALVHDELQIAPPALGQLLLLVALLLLVGLSIGIFKLRGLVPLAGSKLREYLAVGKHYLLLAEDASVKPIFELRGLKAKIDQIGTSLTDRFAQKGKNL